MAGSSKKNPASSTPPEKAAGSESAPPVRKIAPSVAAPSVPRTVLTVLEWLLLLCPFLFGVFFPWGSALVSVILSVLLILLLRQDLLRMTFSAPFLTAASIVLFHFGGMFWGTDRGMALVGAAQFLPLPLFVLLLEQYAPEQRMPLLRKLPYVASLMVVLSFLLSRFVVLEGWFLVAGRQAGFFQYPNTYAVYLLFAIVLVLFGEPLRFGRLPWLILLILGIVLSGSRIVFFLLLAVLVLAVFRTPSRTTRLNLLGLAVVTIGGSLLYVLLTGRKESIGRFLTVSFTASEFLGRLLYAQDALPVILRHPFGLGYTGYRCLQGSFQTGVYFVQHVHNELLQLLLDVGWIPAGLFLSALWRSLRSPQGGFCRRLLLLVLLVHCLLDFDTQFVSVAMLLFLVLDVEDGATGRRVPNPLHAKVPSAAVLAVLSLLSIWIGAASFFYYLRDPAMAARLYPGYTAALTDLLPNASEEDMDVLSARVLRLNGSVALAHDARAKTDFASGSFSGMLSHKQESIRLSRYNLSEYLDYFDMLQISYNYYIRNGDTASADRCLALIAEIPEMLDEVKAQTSRLGTMIQDQPKLDLPADYADWMTAHGLTNS